MIRKSFAVALAAVVMTAFASSAIQQAGRTEAENSFTLNYGDIEDYILQNSPSLKEIEYQVNALVNSKDDINDANNAIFDAAQALQQMRDAMSALLVCLDPSDNTTAATLGELVGTPETPAQYAAAAALSGLVAAGRLSASETRTPREWWIYLNSRISDLTLSQAGLGVTISQPKQYTLDKAKLQLEQARMQLPSAAQSLYIQYNAMTDSLSDLRQDKALVDKSVEIAKVQFERGLISELDLLEKLSQQKSVDEGVSLMQTGLERLAGELNLLLGREYDAPLIIGIVPSPDTGYAERADTEADYAEAKKTNIAIRLRETAEEEARDISDDSRKNAVRLTALEESRFDMTFKNVYDTLNAKTRLYSIETESFEIAHKRLEAAKIKLERGLISAVEYQSEEAAYAKRRSKLKAAGYELFSAVQSCRWLLRGLSPDSASQSGV